MKNKLVCARKVELSKWSTMSPTKDKVVHMASFGSPRIENDAASASSQDRKKIPVPPPATRHRGVLHLTTPVPLYDFGNGMQQPTLMSIINESRDAQPLFNVSSVCTDNQRFCALDNQMAIITIRLYSSEFDRPVQDEEGLSYPKMKEIQAVMPKTWTPRMYLGAVNVSIERSHSIVIETIYFHGKRYVSINDVHWLFTEPNLNNPSLVASKLLSNAAYFNVVGGELNSFNML